MRPGRASARAWVVVGVVILAPLVLWAAARPLDSRFASATASLVSLANIAALAGTAAFAVNVVIGSRVPAIVRLSGGPEAMYAAHRRLGAYALALLAAHAVLAAGHAAADSVDDALRLLLPASGWAVFAGSIALASMTAGLALTFFGQLRHETFIIVQRALGVTFIVAALHALGVPGIRSSTSLLAYFSILTALAVSALVYRSLLGRFLARRHRYIVTSVSRLDESITEVQLEPTGGAMSFLAGQFVFVSFRSDAVSREPHPYSIASSPRASMLDIVVKALGDHTAALRTLPPGALADVEGPYGAFSYLNVPSVRQIWIAGGIGVTPFLSMARSLEVSAYEIDFYYCTEGAEHAHFFDELCEIADRDPRFRVIPVRKRSLGRISAEDIVGVSLPFQHNAAILICGPLTMIENLTKQFLEIGVPPSQLFFEDFSFLGSGVAAKGRM